MKSKRNLYILIPAVVLIWASIVYRIYEGKQEEISLYRGGGKQEVSTINSPNRLAYELLLNYEDPFLKGVKKRSREKPVEHLELIAGINENGKKKISTGVEKEDIWSQVKYLGIIENKRSKNKIILLEIQGNSFIQKLGEEKEGFLLKKITQDSILLKKGKEEAFIRK